MLPPAFLAVHHVRPCHRLRQSSRPFSPLRSPLPRTAPSKPPQHRSNSLPTLCAEQERQRPQSTPASSAPSSSDRPSNRIVYRVEVVNSIAGIDRDFWDLFASAGCNSPFLRHDWLRCLEASGSVSRQTGWDPSHIILRNPDSDEIVAMAPAYLKSHSMGEFVFDQAWADAAYSAEITYYPKLLLAVPFTPASGRRILTHPSISGKQRHDLLLAMAQGLIHVCKSLQISSVHVNFCRMDEVNALSMVGFLLRTGVQYHFTNYVKGSTAISEHEKRLSQQDPASGNVPLPSFCTDIPEDGRRPYSHFDDYLHEFKSKRRLNIRRERRVIREQSGLTIEIVRGDDITDDLLVQMYDLYKSTIDKQFFGRQYLSRSFFAMLADCPDFKRYLCLVLARSQGDGRLIGGTFNVISDGTSDGDDGAFYGRYWGSLEDVRFLHFEACYYSTIEYCIDNGLSRMEPGAGGGDFKYTRGFEPFITTSMHYIRDERLSEAVSSFLQVESVHIDGAVDYMQQRSAIRSKAAKPPS